MFKAIRQKSFFVNLLVIAGIIALIILLFFSLLGVITKHDDTARIPSVTGKDFNEAKRILESAGLDVAIQDSVYTDTAAKLQVMRQSPEEGASVKTGRTVYLTINRAVPPLVEMPDLRGFSLRSALMYLESIGLKLGDTSFVPDIARNAVKEQLVKGKNIAPGTKINMGTYIDFVIGSGISEEQMNVPDLFGMTVSDARSLLSTYNIELGAVVPLESLKDTANAFITRQKPEPVSVIADGETIVNKISPGQVIDVFITRNMPVRDTLPPAPAQ